MKITLCILGCSSFLPIDPSFHIVLSHFNLSDFLQYFLQKKYLAINPLSFYFGNVFISLMFLDNFAGYRILVRIFFFNTLNMSLHCCLDSFVAINCIVVSLPVIKFLFALAFNNLTMLLLGVVFCGVFVGGFLGGVVIELFRSVS